MVGGSPSPASDEAAPTEQADQADAAAGKPRVPASRRWLLALLAICAVALGIRFVYLFGWQDVDEIGGDAYYYHAAANLLADGEGFVHPYLWDGGIEAPGADHPPGYSVVLAVPSLLGFDSIRAHQIVSCLMGTATVGLVGLLGRRVAGTKVGLLAAGIAAVYPNLWLSDASLMSESLALLMGSAVTLLAYWTWDEPSLGRFSALGVTIGLASLVRAETAMLLVLLLVPLCCWAPKLSGGWRPRLERGALAAGLALVVMAPWVVANLVRFEHPSTLSTQMGPTLEVANCDETYDDRVVGGWWVGCASELQELDAGEAAALGVDPGVYLLRGGEPLERLPDGTDPYDRSELDQATRKQALDYMGDNAGRVPFVLAARFARAWGVYEPNAQIADDVASENRPYDSGKAGLYVYYLLVPLSVVGIVALRRKGVPSFPLTVWFVNVSITVVAFYGTTRFRAPAEPSLAVLGAVGLVWCVAWVRNRREPAAEDPSPAGASGAGSGETLVKEGDGERVISALHG